MKNLLILITILLLVSCNYGRPECESKLQQTFKDVYYIDACEYICIDYSNYVYYVKTNSRYCSDEIITYVKIN